ncbi:MAG: hypothetical protein FJX76_02650 [Armatimonadetes bacterium]|nr:hypothetical protein [Armatimonadota bacterium]
MREERPLTDDERQLLTSATRNLSRMRVLMGLLALIALAVAATVAVTLTSHRGQAVLPALGSILILILQQTVARDPGRARDLAGGKKIVLRAPLESVSAVPYRGRWIVRVRLADESLKMYRKNAPRWAVGDEVEVHVAPHSRDVLWAAKPGTIAAERQPLVP